MIFQWYSALWTGVSTQKQGVASTQKSALFYTFLGANLHKNKGSSTQTLPPIYTKNAVSESPIFMPEWMYLHKSCRQSTRSASFSLKLTHVPVSSVLQNVYPPELLFPDTIRAGERKETDFAVFCLAALIYQYLYGYFTSHRFCVDRPRFLCRYSDFSAVNCFAIQALKMLALCPVFALSPFSPKIALKNAKKEPCRLAGLFLDFIHPLRVLRSSLLSGWAGY